MIFVHTRSNSSTTGQISVKGRYFPCAIGRSGKTARKREGDGATPIGRWSILSAKYRPDRVQRPHTNLPTSIIDPSDGWCDSVGDRNYNRPVSLPYPKSSENMWREDHLYNLCVIIDYNISTRTQGAGSAIFFHLAHSDFRPTEGCIAVLEKDMRIILKNVQPGDEIYIV